MFVLILKFILAFVLTAIPFVFHYWIKPKSKISPKWKNSISFLETNHPYFLRRKRMAVAWLLRVYRKMKFSRNARKFFTYILIVILLAFQVVDFQAAKYADVKLNEIATNTYVKSHTNEESSSFLGEENASIIWNAHTTPFGAFALCLTITLAAFRIVFQTLY